MRHSAVKLAAFLSGADTWTPTLELEGGISTWAVLRLKIARGMPESQVLRQFDSVLCSFHLALQTWLVVHDRDVQAQRSLIADSVANDPRNKALADDFRARLGRKLEAESSELKLTALAMEFRAGAPEWR